MRGIDDLLEQAHLLEIGFHVLRKERARFFLTYYQEGRVSTSVSNPVLEDNYFRPKAETF